MRTASLSLVVIALALAAIVAGFLGGRASSHPPATVALHPLARPTDGPQSGIVRDLLRASRDSATVDAFAGDDAVVERPASAAITPPHLSIVVGLTGDSAVIDAQFLELNVPVAFDLDPSAPDAARFADLVRKSGNVLLLHVGTAPTKAQVAFERARLGPFDGIACRNAAGMARALAGTGLTFFDETGDADAGEFHRAGVTAVSRDATVDDRTEQSYVEYMLERTAVRASREGRLVVLMRPLPNSLHALERFAQSSLASFDAIR